MKYIIIASGGLFMAIDIMFEPSGANIVNLKSLSRDKQLLDERRACELHEIASELVRMTLELLDMGMGVCEVLSLLSESNVIPEPQGGGENDSDSDKAIFCSFVCELLKAHGTMLSENMFLPTQEMPETFTYVKNTFADEAYDIFSQDFADPRVVYSKSFKDALTLVSDGAASYCLLPIEERGIRLSTVSELLFKGDFKIASVTPILGFDGLADVKYAMISRSFASLAFEADDDRYLELRLPKELQVPLSEILSVAEKYGLKLYKLNTMRFDTEAGARDYFSVIFESAGTDFTCMLIYLTLFVDEFVAVGVYKNIE